MALEPVSQISHGLLVFILGAGMTDMDIESSSASTKGGRRTEMLKTRPPAEPKKCGENRPPTIGGSLLMVFLMVLVQGLAAVVTGFAFASFSEPAASSYAPIAWAVFVADVLIFVLLYSALRESGPVSPLSVGVRLPKIPMQQCLILGVLLFVAILIVDELYILFLENDIQQDIREIFQGLANSGDMAAMSVWVFAIVVGAPIIEEFVFRGYLQTALANRLGPVAGVVIASLIFGLIHFDLEALPVLVTAGLGFGYIYHKTGSLLPSMLLHFAMNGWATTYLLVFEIT